MQHAEQTGAGTQPIPEISTVEKILARNTETGGQNAEPAIADAAALPAEAAPGSDAAVISEEIAGDFPWAKAFVGKPMKEVLRAVEDSFSNISNRTQGENVSHRTSNEDAAEPIQTGDAIADMKNSLRNELLAEMQERFAPALRASIDYEAKRIEEQIKQQLPPDADVQALLGSWVEANKELAPFFAAQPEKLITDVLRHYKAEAFDAMNKRIAESALRENPARTGLQRLEASPYRYFGRDMQADAHSTSPTLAKIFERNKNKV